MHQRHQFGHFGHLDLFGGIDSDGGPNQDGDHQRRIAGGGHMRAGDRRQHSNAHPKDAVEIPLSGCFWV